VVDTKIKGEKSYQIMMSVKFVIVLETDSEERVVFLIFD
jgi:hypothetical protein